MLKKKKKILRHEQYSPKYFHISPPCFFLLFLLLLLIFEQFTVQFCQPVLPITLNSGFSHCCPSLSRYLFLHPFPPFKSISHLYLGFSLSIANLTVYHSHVLRFLFQRFDKDGKNVRRILFSSHKKTNIYERQTDGF